MLKQKFFILYDSSTLQEKMHICIIMLLYGDAIAVLVVLCVIFYGLKL